MSENHEEFVVSFTADVSSMQNGVDKLIEQADSLSDSSGETKANIQALAQLFADTFGDEKNPFAYIPRELESSLRQSIGLIQRQIVDVRTSLDSALKDETLMAGLNQQIGYLSANLGDVLRSAHEISRFTSRMSSEARVEFGRDLRDIRQKLAESTYNSVTRGKMGAASDRALIDVFMSQHSNAAGVAAMAKRHGMSNTEASSLIRSMLPFSAPSTSRSDFYSTARMRAAGALPRIDHLYEHMSYRDRLPDRFKNLPVGDSEVLKAEEKKQALYAEFITDSERKIVFDLAKRNEVFRQSLIQAGVGSYQAKQGKQAGLFRLKNQITRLQLAQAEGFLFYEHLMPAWEGDPVNFRKLSDQSRKAQRSLVGSSSTTVTDALSALQALSTVNPDINPVYDKSVAIVPHDGKSSTIIGQIGSPKRPRYAVMSLTPEDFKNGVNPPASRIDSKRERFRDTLGGVSSYIMLEDSMYTSLAGMHGHNTPGTGKRGSVANDPHMFDEAPIIIIDYSSSILAKDKDGRLVYGEDGSPMADEQVMHELQELFTPSAHFEYTPEGSTDQRSYHYPRVVRTVGGKERGYVPTHIKGGGVYLIDEESYVRSSQASLQKLGVNIFDNFADLDDEYEYADELNKVFEGGNRFLTPSTPFERIGGVNPKRIGFVDMEDLFGHDGSMFFMPGHVPGQDAILRAPGIKGVGQTVDFKQIIRETYGQGLKEFYLPGLNTPANLRDLFKMRGIGAISEGDRQKYFVDIMQMDALIPDSVIKTSRLKGKTSAEASDFMSKVFDLFGGFRVVDTASGMRVGNQRALSTQISQNLVLTESEIKSNVEAWDNFIHSLENDFEAQKKYVFNRENDPLDIAIRANPTLLETHPLARYRLESMIEAARLDRSRGKILAEKQLSMRLALANPGHWITAAAKMNGLTATNAALENILRLDDATVGAVGFDESAIGGARFPNTFKEDFGLDISEDYVREVIRRFGLNPDAIYMNPETIGRMGGGDFDGDTVQIVTGWLVDAFKRTYETHSEALDQHDKTEEQKKQEKEARKAQMRLQKDSNRIDQQKKAELLYRQVVAPLHMGAVSNAIDALSQGNWDDEAWVKRTGAGALELRSMYDIDSTFAKTGILAKWGEAATNARYMGKPFVSIFKNLESAIESGDFSEMAKFSDVNYPSIFSSQTALVMAGLSRNPMPSELIEKLIAVQRLKEGIAADLVIGDAKTPEQARAQFFDLSIESFAEMLTRGAVLSNETLGVLDSRLRVWEAMVSGKEVGLGQLGITDDRKAQLEKQLEEIKRQRQKLRNVRIFGLSERNVAAGLGYAGSKKNAGDKGFFFDMPLTGQGGAFYSEESRVTRQHTIDSLRNIAAIALSPKMNAALEASVPLSSEIEDRINRGVQRADELRHSYTSLSEFNKIPNGPEQWFKTYGLKIREPENGHMALGSGVHVAVKKWADSVMRHQADPSEQVLSPSAIQEELDRALVEQHGQFFSQNEDGQVVSWDSKISEKLKDARSFVGNLSEFFKDYLVLASEASGSLPGLGKQLARPDLDVATSAALDLYLQHKTTGRRLVVDVKGAALGPSTEEKYLDQLYLYTHGLLSGGINISGVDSRVDEVGIASYTEGRLDVKPFDQSKLDAVLAKFKDTISQIQRMAIHTGFDADLVNQYVNASRPSVEAGKTAYMRAKPGAETAPDLTSSKSVLHPPTPNSPYSVEEQHLFDERAKVMLGQTGKGIGIGVALQTAIIDYEKELLGMINQLRSKQSKKDSDGIRNPWEGYRYAIEDAYDSREQALKDKGATDADLVDLKRARADAQKTYAIALRYAAATDISDLNNALVEEMNEADGRTPASRFSKQFETLQKRYTEARLAYETLKAKQDKTDDDKASIESAERELKELDKTKKAREDQIRAKSKEAFDADAASLRDIALYGRVSERQKTEEQIKAFKQRIENNILQADTDLKKGVITQDERDRRINEMRAIDQDKYAERTRRESKERIGQQYDTRIKSLTRSLSGHNLLSSLQFQSEDYKKQIEEIRKSMKEDFMLGNIDRAAYFSNIDMLDQLESKVSVTRLAFIQFGDVVSRTISQFGRQMFHQAINEAKQFVMEYDNIMTEIQMVTLKTDEEIGTIGDSLIDMAIDIKAPVSEVTAAATSLYRQGLDEDQVNARLEDVMKFSKTAKVQADDAIKLITVALSGGMVDSAEEAMDVVSALSDSAATEADQITKGLQKSMSAAKEVGVTYEELVAMLTVITSKTQLSGNIAGTTMRNVMSRLSRVGSNELIFDENGNAISGSAQAQILRTIDVEMYDDGNLRSAFEILSDVGKQWVNLSDAKKNQVAYALGGTEQFSNVAALMQGFAEVDEYGNNLLDKYLQIAEGSDGVTEEKYQHYTENLAASISNLQTTFDSLVESIVGAGDAISGFINFFSSAFEGLSEFNEHTGVITVLGGLAAAVALVSAAFANFPIFIGASIAGAIGLIGNGLKMFYDELEGPSIEEQSGKIDERYGEIQNAVNKIREIDNKRVNGVLSDNDAMALKKAFTELDSLGVKCFNTGADLDALAASAEKTKIALDGVESAAKTQSAAEKGALLSQLVDDINDYVSEPKNVQTKLLDVRSTMPNGDGRSILEYAQEYLRYRTLIHSDSDLSESDQIWLNENRDRIGKSTIYGKAAGLFSEFLLSAKVPINVKVSASGINEEIEFDEIGDFNTRNNAMLSSSSYPNDELMEYLYALSIDAGRIDSLLFGNEPTPGTHFENQIASVLSLQDGVSETGLVNAVAADIAAKINEGYKNWNGEEEFNAGQYLYPLYEPNSTRITASSVVAYAYNNTPEAYSNYIKNRSIDPNGVVQFTKQGAVNALYNASQLSESGSNKYALERMYEAFSTASGLSTQEQLENAAFTLLSGTDKGWLNQETLEILMANKEYEDIAKSISQIYETDTEGNVKVKKGVGEAERTKLLEMIVSKYASDTDMRAYRNDTVKRLSAINTFSKLSESENRFGTWQNLSSMDMMEEQMRDDFIEAIGGKETASKYLDGKFNEAGEFYLDRKIGSYGLGVSPLTDEELIDQAEKLLSFIDSNNGNAYPYVEGLPDEMLTDMYGVVDGLKEYVDVMSTEEPFRTKTAEEVQFMRDTVDTNILLNRIPVGYYMQDVVRTIEQLRGSAADQLTAVGNAISQQSKFEQGKYAFNRAIAGVATSDDYSMLATALGEGWNEEEIKKQIQTNEGQKLIQRALLAETMKFAYVLEEALRQLIPVDSLSLLNSEMDTDQIVDALSGILTEGALTMIQATGAVFDGNGLIIPFDEDSGKTSASTAFENAGLNYSGASDNYRMLNYFIEALRSKDVVGRKQTIANHIDSNPLSAQEDWESFYSNNPELRIVQSAFENGKLSSDEFLSRIQTLMYPGSEKDADYYSPALSSLFGDIGFEDGNVDWNSVLENYQNMMTTDIGQTFLSDISELEGGTEILLELSEALKEGSIDGERCAEALKLITDGMSSRELAKLNKYKKNAEKLEDIYSGISAGGRDAAETILSINERMQDFNNIQWAVDQFESGNRSNKVIDTIVSHFGGDPDDLKKATDDYAKQLSDVFRMSIQDEEAQLQDELATATLAMYNESASEIAKITGESIDIGAISVGGVVDISALLNAMSSSSSAFAKNFVSFIQQMSSYGATLTATTDANGENLTFKWDTSNIDGSTYKGGYGGGGGSKKSAGDKLIERQGHGHDLYEHQIKMVQFEQTRYENADELGNYGKMLEEEIKIEKAYLPVVEANIAALRSEFASVKQGTEEWYKLRDAILEAEELYSDISNSIDENTNKLEENQQAILKLHTDLEEMVVEEIELRLDAENEQLDATVSMEDTILSAVKQRYQDEWDLIKEDIEKKKEALQQEKDLIDERLDARKEAEDEAAKYEELTELKKQLSLIQMDSTRTKDAAELREAIADLEREIGWDIAEKEAENQKNAIQDQIDAYDDFTAKGDEDLSNLLEDANNFSEEVNSVMKLNQEELFNWLKQNVKEYANSLDDAQKQMVKSWEDTYKKMLGITDTYWDEVNAILSSKETFLEYMKQSKEYIYASDDERAQLLYQWEEAYDKWRLAQKNDAKYEHGDSGLGDWSGSEYTSSSSGSGGSGSSGAASNTPSSDIDNAINALGPGVGPFMLYDSNGKNYGRYSQLDRAKSGAQLTAKTNGTPIYVKDSTGRTVAAFNPGGTAIDVSGSNLSSSSDSLPETGWPTSVSGGHGYYYKVTKDGKNVSGSLGGPFTSREAAQAAAAAAAAGVNGKYQTKYFLRGGIADQTGWAWLDGTPQAPERILSAQQTEDFDTLVSVMEDFRNSGVSMDVLRDMMNWSTSVAIPSALSYVGSNAYQGSTANIGDIIVNITEAQIADDRDIDVLADIVGQKFVKEISKQGFNVSRYNF